MDPVFAVAAGLAVGAGLMVVTRRDPVRGVPWMLLCFVALAAVYLRIGASFLAAVHVLVYTGAILVLFVFILMLLSGRPGEGGAEGPDRWPVASAALCLGLFVLLAVSLARIAPSSRLPDPPAGFGAVEPVGRSLFGRHLLPFELVSILILAALFGSVLLARKKP